MRYSCSLCWTTWTVLRSEGRIDVKFCEIAQKLGFEKYPEALDGIYANMVKDNAPACDVQLIDSLEQEWGFFGKYYQVVKETAAAINADPVRSIWVKVAARFAYDNPTPVARTVPVPKADGTAVTDLLPLYIILPQVPAAIAEYRRRGFEDAEIRSLMFGFQDGISIVESQVGRPQVNALYFSWLHHYSKVEIFNTEGFQFELRKLPDNAMWIRNKKDGQVLCLMCAGTFDGTGTQVKGSKNYEDPEDTFAVTLSEDAEKFVGHGVYDNKVSAQACEYPKTQWECIARPGDNCMSLHIPRKADISMAALDKAVASAKKIMTERFADLGGSEIYCASWLLDPMLGVILGPDAKMTKFMERFVKHPIRNAGTSPFGYVFPVNVKDMNTLPEDTSLQRGMKKLYVEGGCIYGYAGLLI